MVLVRKQRCPRLVIGGERFEFRGAQQGVEPRLIEQFVAIEDRRTGLAEVVPDALHGDRRRIIPDAHQGLGGGAKGGFKCVSFLGQVGLVVLH